MRIKYLRFLNPQVILSCTIKKVLDPYSIQGLKEGEMVFSNQYDTESQDNQKENPEKSTVEIVYKLIGPVHTLQKFVVDYRYEGSLAKVNTGNSWVN